MTPDLKSAAFALGATDFRLRAGEVEIWAPAEFHADITRGMRAICPTRTCIVRITGTPTIDWEHKETGRPSGKVWR